MDELGQILSQARENKGLTVEDVQQATRINAHYIEALENGEYNVLPTPVHVRGFLRNYARYLNLDPAPLLERYAAYESRQPVNYHQATNNGSNDLLMEPLPAREDQPFFDPVNVEVDAGSRRDPESAIRLLIIAALIVALGLVANRFLPLLLNNQDGSEAITSGITEAVEGIVNRGEQAIGAEGLVSDRLDLAGTTTPEAPADEEVITSTSRTITGPDILPTPAPTRPALPATMDEINLKVEVTERAWMEATIDDEVVFSGIARPGDIFEWTAQNEAKLLTGNAIGLFVTINETPLGRLGDRGQNKEEIWRTTQ
jgi:cytoskeletal protein RodZ